MLLHRLQVPHLGLDLCIRNKHSASFIRRASAPQSSLGLVAGGTRSLPIARKLPPLWPNNDLYMTVDVPGSHTVTAEAVPVFLNMLKLQDSRTWEIQGRKKFFMCLFLTSKGVNQVLLRKNCSQTNISIDRLHSQI